MSSADAETLDPSAAEAPEAEPAPSDDRRDGVVASIRSKLGDVVVDAHVQPGIDAWVRVTRDGWADTARALKDLGFTFFDYLSAIDWYPNLFGKNEEPPTVPLVAPTSSAELDHGVTGGETRFQLLARVYSPEDKVGLHLKADLPDEDLSAPTWSLIYFGADWHEREIWEMYGITFAGHPNLTHIYLPGSFEGHPLRKDFPLLARHVKPWPGLVDVEAMPGEPDEDEEAAPGDAGESPSSDTAEEGA